MSDQFPTEIWERIFSLACTDDGSTGRSLALVSRYVHDVCLPFQFNAIALTGYGEIRRFADMLERRPSHLRRVRHLCISHHPLRRSDLTFPVVPKGDDALVQSYVLSFCSPVERDLVRQKVQDNPAWRDRVMACHKRIAEECAKTLSRVLQAVAPDVQTLTLQLGSLQLDSLQVGLHSGPTLLNVDFPSLVEFTLHVRPLTPHPEIRVPRFPSLKCLHLISCCVYLPAFVDSFPTLTRLRLSGFPLQHSIALDIVRASIAKPAAADPLTAVRLPLIDQVIIEPVHIPRTAVALLRNARSYEALILHDSLNKLTALKYPDQQSEYSWRMAKTDWMDRLGGGLGCWKEHYDVSELHSRASRMFHSPY